MTKLTFKVSTAVCSCYNIPTWTVINYPLFLFLLYGRHRGRVKLCIWSTVTVNKHQFWNNTSVSKSQELYFLLSLQLSTDSNIWGVRLGTHWSFQFVPTEDCKRPHGVNLDWLNRECFWKMPGIKAEHDFDGQSRDQNCAGNLDISTKFSTPHYRRFKAKAMPKNVSHFNNIHVDYPFWVCSFVYSINIFQPELSVSKIFDRLNLYYIRGNQNVRNPLTTQDIPEEWEILEAYQG